MKSLLSIVFCLVGILACQEMQSQKEATAMTSSGYRYTIFKNVDGPTPPVEGYVMLHTTMMHKDSIISDTRQTGRPALVKIENEEQRGASPSGPVQDLLELLSVGDSARLYYPLDSFKMKPKRLENFEEITYDIVIERIFNNEAEMQSYYEEERQKAEAERQNMKGKEEEIISQMADFYAAYKNGSLPQEWQTTDSGLKYMILDKGNTGVKAPYGEYVRTHYYGFLESTGEQFDNSFKRGETFNFAIGKDPVIKGWEEAFQLIEKGDKAMILVPGSLAYGEQGYPGVIPPNASLFFYVELIGVGTSE